jgi:putative cardiolipin synthase
LGTVEVIVDTPAGEDPSVDFPIQLASAYIDLIEAAEQDLLLVSAYFIPTPELTQALERAVDRGLVVRILTNSLGSNNHVTAHAAYAQHRPALLRAGVDLYELRADASTRAMYTFKSLENGILGLHAKLALFDDCCLLVGSSNLDPRSLRLNTEIGVLVDSPSLNQHLRQLLAVDLLPANAWRVILTDGDNIVWTGPGGEIETSPPASFFMRSESWFFGLLPIEDQM